jgi:hypothetical protein
LGALGEDLNLFYYTGVGESMNHFVLFNAHADTSFRNCRFIDQIIFSKVVSELATITRTCISKLKLLMRHKVAKAVAQKLEELLNKKNEV